MSDITTTDVGKPAPAVDQSAHAFGWTAQSGEALVSPADVPGNVVTVAELPYESSLQAQGIVPAAYRAGLYIADDEDQKALLKRETPEQKAAQAAEAEAVQKEQDDHFAAAVAAQQADVLDRAKADAKVVSDPAVVDNSSTQGTPGEQPKNDGSSPA